MNGRAADGWVGIRFCRSQSLADQYASSEIGQTASVSLFYTKDGSSTHLGSESTLFSSMLA